MVASTPHCCFEMRGTPVLEGFAIGAHLQIGELSMIVGIFIVHGMHTN